MKQMITIATAGNVDDGKSTLIGRLLFEHDAIKEDHWEDMGMQPEDIKLHPVSLARITDGLKYEREKGITMDVAYRYFQKEGVKYKMVDAPGHEEYTFKMLSAAYQADVLLILIDITKEIMLQTWRHISIASMLQVPKVVFVLNKIDLVDDIEMQIQKRESELQEVIQSFPLNDFCIVPVSALTGENVIKSSENKDLNTYNSLWSAINSLPVNSFNKTSQYLDIQYLIKCNSDRVLHLAHAFNASLNQSLPEQWYCASSGQQFNVDFLNNKVSKTINFPVTFSIKEENIHLQRGDRLLNSPGNFTTSNRLNVQLYVLDANETMENKQDFLFQFTTKTIRGTILEEVVLFPTKQFENVTQLKMKYLNGILELEEPMTVLDFQVSKAWGSFTIIHPQSLETIGLGVVKI